MPLTTAHFHDLHGPFFYFLFFYSLKSILEFRKSFTISDTSKESVSYFSKYTKHSYWKQFVEFNAHSVQEVL